MARWILPGVLVSCAAFASPAAAQQQGSVQVSSAAQVVVADPARRAGQPTVEPDIGLTVYQPGLRAGIFHFDVHAVRRAESAHLGRWSLGVRDLKLGGLTWSLTGGDNSVAPALSNFLFSNLFAPQVTFSGGQLAGFAPRGSVTLTAGRVTALRNIFGTDPQTVGQDMGLFNARFRTSTAVEVFAHASHVRTYDAREFTYYVDRGDDAGGGVRVRPIPTFELIADAGLSRYRRKGAAEQEQSVTALVGGKWALTRGWFEINAQRFAPGYFAVLNTPYLDREGAYASGELEVAGPLRVFGGYEAFRTNLDPAASTHASVSVPKGLSQRGFVGARLHLGGTTYLTLRGEDGDRAARPVNRPGAEYDSDTGVLSVEVQSAAKTLTGFARYERRENVDHSNASGTYEQHTGSVQVFGRVTNALQIFGSATLMQQDRTVGGQTFLQGGGGLQFQLPGRQLWLRSEGLFTRSDDWQSDVTVPSQLFTLGLAGQLTPRTVFSFDVNVDRAPRPASTVSPWLTRSMFRISHRIPTGSARVGTSVASHSVRRRGNGTVAGLAFADWNANGQLEAGEDPLPGVPFVFEMPREEQSGTQVMTGPTGEFAFVNVPQGRARVRLDLSALPVDYDPPEMTRRETEVRERRGEKLTFGLIPLGSVNGRVVQDADHDGHYGPGDAPVDGAVVLLDDGERSEQTRDGAFRFDAVRPGAHAVTLLRESLPEGASVSGEPRTEVVLDRANMQPAVTFLVRLEKRPEIRRVFPQKTIAQKAASPRDTASASASAPRTAAVRTPAVAAPATSATRRGARETSARGIPDVWFVVQLAATHDRASARAMVDDLLRRGIDAYLSEDADGLAKVRIGSYRTRAAANDELARLRDLHLEGWIARIGTR